MKKLVFFILAIPFLINVTAFGGDRFQEVADASGDVVIDNSTDLIWQKDDADNKGTWPQAFDYCSTKTFGGYATGWRLPNQKELQSIVNYDATSDPAIYPKFSDTTPDHYWSSTTSRSDDDKAFYVFFRTGTMSSKDKNPDNAYIRCVRTKTQ